MNILAQRSAASEHILGTFWLGGDCSRDYGIALTAPPPDVFAERDVETISVAGRNGDLIMDRGRYKNIPIPYQCAVIPQDGETIRTAIWRLRNILFSGASYRRLENSFDPDHYRMARVREHTSVESIVEQAGRFEISFECLPQRFLHSGEQPISMTAPGQLYNEHFPALPLIRVTGTGDSTITVGSTVVQIYGQTETIWLDCDTQNAYSMTAEGILQNRNHLVSAPVFPVLEPGVNTVAWTGGITALEVTPKWWTL